MEEHNGEEDRKSKSTHEVALEITQLEPIKKRSSMTYNVRQELELISFPCCIFHIPTKFLTQKQTSYLPIILSIGPFHHDKLHLQHMETHKWKYLNSLLNRTFTKNTTLDSCIRALKELETSIRSSYDTSFARLSSDEFLTMILLDAGFIIELFLRHSITSLRTRDDTLLKSREMLYDLRNDLILLENQIPFFVLRTIFSLVPIPKQCEKSISELSLYFFKSLIPKEIHILNQKYNFEGSNHLLDLIWKCYLPSFYKVPICSGSNLGRDIHSVSKLQESGIKVRGAEAESILDVIFDDGKLIIPTLKIHNHMEILFRNLIALEHCYIGNKFKYITSYVHLMRGLLDSEDDVRLFYQQKILVDKVKSKKDVVSLFKNLCEDVDLEEFYYGEVCEEVKKCKRTKWDVWCYKVKEVKRRKEVNGKWGVTLVLFVIVLLLCGGLCVVLYLFFRHERRASKGGSR